MQYAKSKFNVLERVAKERDKRGWSNYTLSKKAQIPQSTISTWYNRGIQPSLALIEKLCDGFDMSLSEFFEEMDEN